MADWCCPIVKPYNGIVEGLPSVFVPDDGCLSLVSNSNSLYSELQSLLLCRLCGTIYALLHCCQELQCIVLNPPGQSLEGETLKQEMPI